LTVRLPCNRAPRGLGSALVRVSVFSSRRLREGIARSVPARMSSVVQESRKRFYVYARAPLVELTAEAIVELFRRDARARRELAVLLVSEPEVRLAIINAVLRDVATKSDIERLRESLESRFEQHRSATKSDIEALRASMERGIEELRSEFRREIDFLAREIDRLYRLVMVSVLGILISIATTILVRVLLPP